MNKKEIKRMNEVLPKTKQYKMYYKMFIFLKDEVGEYNYDQLIKSFIRKDFTPNIKLKEYNY